MAGCDEFEIAIEKEMHGALAEAGRPGLDAHLARCERCRAYRAAARGVEADMGEVAGRAVRALDWSRVERGARGGVFRALQVLVTVVLGAGYLLGLVWISSAPAFREQRLLRMLPAMGMLVVLVALVAGWSARRLVAQAGREEMLDTYRAMVAANLAWARRMQWAVAILLALFLYKALTGTSTTHDPLVYYGGLAIPVGATWAWLRHVKVPRARREAADLGLDAGGGR